MRHITISKRHLPGRGYSYYKPSSKIVVQHSIKKHNIYEGDVVTSTGQQLPLHEINHYSIVDKETGLAVGVLTSAKDSKKGNHYLAPENVSNDILLNDSFMQIRMSVHVFESLRNNYCKTFFFNK